MAAGRGRQREPVHRVQPHRRPILAEQNLRVARRRFAAPVVGRGHVQPAQLIVALELRVLGVDLNRLAAAPVVNSTARSSTRRPCCES